MLLALYGSLRKDQTISGYLDELRSLGTSETLAIPGVKIYVVGEVPGVKITNDPEDEAVMEIISADVDEYTEEVFLGLLDAIEGVEVGLYERDTINTPRGMATIYTICGNVSHCVSIKDWVEWQKVSTDEKRKAMEQAGKTRIILS